MQAVICRRHGAPGDLEVGELEAPSPGPGEVVIDVHACSVNYPDVLMVAGQYQVQPPLPFVPGAEYAGVVAATGDGVRDVEPGQRVIALAGHGGMAEQACLDARKLMPIPDGMDFDTAAAFMLAYSTSWHALKQRAALQPGETLLVLGAAGGVGLTAVELGRLAGARVIAAASSADKLALAADYGASELIDYGREPLAERVKALTDGRGADVIYDPVGGDLFDQCLRAVAWNGRLLVVGFAAGRIQQIPANLPLLKGSSVVGVFWGRFAELQPAAQAANARELLEHYEAGRLRPHISSRYPLDAAPEAIGELASRRARGKVVVQVRPPAS